MFIYSTFPNEESVKQTAKHLVENRLAACVNYWPINSVYEWQGEINEDKEWACIIKTHTSKAEEIIEYIKANHPYSTPAIISINVSFHGTYKSWLEEQLGI